MSGAVGDLDDCKCFPNLETSSMHVLEKIMLSAGEKNSANEQRVEGNFAIVRFDNILHAAHAFLAEDGYLESATVGCQRRHRCISEYC